MTAADDDRTMIRRYLLRDLDEAAEAGLDERVLTDPAFFEAVELVEDDLIEEYQQGKIAEADRAGIEGLLRAPDCQRQLQLTKALARRFEGAQLPRRPRQRADAVASSGTIPTAGYRPTWVALAAAASLLISSGTAVYLGVQASRLRTELEAAVRPQMIRLGDLDQRLTKIAAASPPAFSFLLLPDSSQRSAGAAPAALELPGAADRIALQLDLVSTPPSASYRVTIRRAGGPQVWGEAGLRRPDDSSPQLTVTVPATLMTPDDYLIDLSGADGQPLAGYRLRLVAR